MASDGRSPFNDWLEGLRDLQARARIESRLDRVRLGNLGDYVSVGGGVFELRLFCGPGYRVYYSMESNDALLLLLGGTKGTQKRDVRIAKAHLADYRKRNYGN